MKALGNVILTEVSIPTGLCRLAQSCEERATLGVGMEGLPTPSGLQQANGSRCNPVGVGEFFRPGPRVARSSQPSSQPWANCWNPVGIPGNGSLRFIVTSVFAAALLAVTVSPLRAQLVADGATNTL